uniref:Uncharacterized protein n=1 Tax=Thermus sp. WG TaxID=1312524 RepID=R4JDZ4_9DEIN|nr:hypothetical protein WG16_12 [Thermus sp. WG]
MIRRLARLLWEVARGLPDPERDPDLGPFCTYLRRRYGRHPRLLSPPRSGRRAFWTSSPRPSPRGGTGTGPPAPPGTRRGRASSPASRGPEAPSPCGAGRKGRPTGRPEGRG